MPYTSNPLHSSQVLQHLQSQLLMQGSPAQSSPHFSIPTDIKADVESIAQDLSRTISNNTQDSAIGTSSKGKLSGSSQGKVHR